MNRHPYEDIPPHARWRLAMSGPREEVDPVVSFGVRIDRGTKVVTAGSCFAQHIARHLRENGYTALTTEAAHPLISSQAADFGYALYAARYGNIYTARQLVQLFNRAYGSFTPLEDVWHDDRGGLIDPFRPQVQPGGFPSTGEYRADREQHFAAVRRAFEESDVIVFTLGLTEAWSHAVDGAVFPVCPGVAGGVFDPTVHRFLNFTADEVAGDLRTFAMRLRAVNARCKIVLTVSPVPLVATASDSHVLVATTLSKSILRVAVERAAQEIENVHYFPSYEIITGSHAGGQYFASDRRSVTEEGVRHVMRLFFAHATDAQDFSPTVPAQTASSLDLAEEVVRAHCDEELLDR